MPWKESSAMATGGCRRQKAIMSLSERRKLASLLKMMSTVILPTLTRTNQRGRTVLGQHPQHTPWMAVGVHLESTLVRPVNSRMSFGGSKVRMRTGNGGTPPPISPLRPLWHQGSRVPTT